MKWLKRVFIIIFVLFLFIQLGLGFFSSGTCGIGLISADDGIDPWMCVWAVRLGSIGFVFGIGGLLLVLKTNKAWLKYAGYFFIIFSLLFPGLVINEYYSLPKDIVTKYYSGITPEACERGRPIVPWGDQGKLFSNDCEKLRYRQYSENACETQPINKTDCFTELALRENDISLCSKAYSEIATTSRVDTCVTRIARLNRNPQQCFEMQKMPVPPALKINNLNYNDSISYCVSTIAQDFEDVSLCDKILPGNYSWIRNTCIQQFNEHKKSLK